MLTVDDPLPHRPRRVLVAGVSGVGKTTLANRIAVLTGGRRTEIDSQYHGPGWTQRPEFLDDVRAAVDGEAWTIEWQYTVAQPMLSAAADLLVWLDLPYFRVTLPSVIRRTVRRSRRREELWNGNFEPPLRTILSDRDHIVRWSIRTRHQSRERVAELERERPELTIVRLRSRHEIERWLAGPLARAVG